MASGEARIGVDAPCGGSKVAMRNRWAWGPTYFGPGKRSVTRATGQTVLQTLHFRHSSAESATSRERRLVDDLLDRHRAAPAFWRSARGSRRWLGREHRGGAPAAGHRNAVAAALGQVALAGEQAADDRDVVERDLAAAVDRVQLLVGSDARGLERVPGRIERIVRQPLPYRRGLDRQAEQRLDERSVGPADEPTAGNPTRRQDEAARTKHAVARRRGHHNGGHPSPGGLDPDHLLPHRDPAAAATQRIPERGEQAQARDAWRDQRHLERDERQ